MYTNTWEVLLYYTMSIDRIELHFPQYLNIRKISILFQQHVPVNTILKYVLKHLVVTISLHSFIWDLLSCFLFCFVPVLFFI